MNRSTFTTVTKFAEDNNVDTLKLMVDSLIKKETSAASAPSPEPKVEGNFDDLAAKVIRIANSHKGVVTVAELREKGFKSPAYLTRVMAEKGILIKAEKDIRRVTGRGRASLTFKVPHVTH